MTEHEAAVERLAAVVHGMVGLDEQGAVMWALRLGVELRVLHGRDAVVTLEWMADRVNVVLVEGVVVESFVG